MGKYLNTDSKGNQLGASLEAKLFNLIGDGADLVTDVKYQPNLVCIADNGPFAYAAYIDSEAEFKRFAEFDGRTKLWVTHPQAAELAD